MDVWGGRGGGGNSTRISVHRLQGSASFWCHSFVVEGAREINPAESRCSCFFRTFRFGAYKIKWGLLCNATTHFVVLLLDCQVVEGGCTPPLVPGVRLVCTRSCVLVSRRFPCLCRRRRTNLGQFPQGFVCLKRERRAVSSTHVMCVTAAL